MMLTVWSSAAFLTTFCRLMPTACWQANCQLCRTCFQNVSVTLLNDVRECVVVVLTCWMSMLLGHAEQICSGHAHFEIPVVDELLDIPIDTLFQCCFADTPAYRRFLDSRKTFGTLVRFNWYSCWFMMGDNFCSVTTYFSHHCDNILTFSEVEHFSGFA